MTNGKIGILPAEKTVTIQKKKQAEGVGGLLQTATAADALQAVETIVGALSDQHQVRQEHRTMREAMRSQSALVRKQISANRHLLETYVKRTFDGRDAVIGGLLDALDVAVASGDAETARSMADNLAAIVKSGPLIQAADLHQQIGVDVPFFRIGKKN